MSLLFHSTAARLPVWRSLFAADGEPLIEGEDAVTDPAGVTAIACWVPPADLSRYPNLRAVISVGAGVDHLPPLPDGVALSRTLAPGIEAMVRDWVVMATLMLHRDMPAYLEQARAGDWCSHPVRLASSRRVGILGMGRIGALAAESLQSLGFEVAGLSRSERTGAVPIFAASQIDAFLARSDLLVCLLPLTPETRGILNAKTLSALPRGAGLIHAGRGAHLDPEALRAALDDGQISAAMLDVTDPEPLPQGHWMWRDPRVIVTPHVGANTDAAEGARHALAVMRALRDGTPLPGLVDRARGY
ncbi:2-hydroxyacid dehydrogenase [Jannaschia formosa]|uniref:2-hydroxyacid dehydrogenase n=1 Tax=Jannaschia formosa TaxID=2259592 RepID=UPI000E1B8CE8|nr:glyoxylate/hydroxypyruvate reductase A [Jannaschia formosa]TFL17163.1 glyoxylate/hydroxypyruvate reductase A [Jannaschia formosa]